MAYSGRASNSESRGPGSIPTDGTVLGLRARHIKSPEYWLTPRKRWLRPDMTKPEDQWSCKRSPESAAYITKTCPCNKQRIFEL